MRISDWSSDVCSSDLLFWGPELCALYNEAYAPTIGDKHPRVLGRPAREGWTELWDDLEPLLRSVIDRGQSVHAKDRPFYIERDGGQGEQDRKSTRLNSSH